MNVPSQCAPLVGEDVAAGVPIRADAGNVGPPDDDVDVGKDEPLGSFGWGVVADRVPLDVIDPMQ